MITQPFLSNQTPAPIKRGLGLVSLAQEAVEEVCVVNSDLLTGFPDDSYYSATLLKTQA